MKKVLSLVLAVLLVAAMLCACTPNADTNPTTTGKPAGSTPTPTTTGTPTPTTTGTPAPQGPAVINVADFLNDESKWEYDYDCYEMKDGKLVYDTFFAGEFAALRLKEEAQDVTYKFNVTITDLAPVSMEDYTWWDSELCIIARSAMAASSWPDEDGSQKGYTLTFWGDMSKVCIGRCGFDDAFGEFDCNIGDGQAHAIEFTVANNADGTVAIKLVLDGNMVAELTDDGTKIKNDRPSLYPDAGGLTIRAKWLGVTIS